MSYNLVKLLYNPSSLSSISPSEKKDSAHQDLETFVNKGSGEKIFDFMTNTITQNSPKNASLQLISMKKILLDPMGFGVRYFFLKRLNAFLETLSNLYQGHMEIFQASIQIVTLIKNQIEHYPQQLHQDSRAEWIELEKSVYTLSRWEDRLQHFWEASH